MPLLNEFQEAWRTNGAIFGYPQCCIDWFVGRSSRIFSAKTTEEANEAVKVADNQQGYTYGFIPCPECAKKVVPGTEGSLIKNRTAPHPYPDDSGVS